MTYYRIKKESDGVRRISRRTGNGKIIYEGEFVANELYTEAEAKRYWNVYVNSEIVQIKKPKPSGSLDTVLRQKNEVLAMKHLIITLTRQTLSFVTFPFIILRTLCAVILQTRTSIDLTLCQLDDGEQTVRWGY